MSSEMISLISLMFKISKRGDFGERNPSDISETVGMGVAWDSWLTFLLARPVLATSSFRRLRPDLLLGLGLRPAPPLADIELEDFLLRL